MDDLRARVVASGARGRPSVAQRKRSHRGNGSRELGEVFRKARYALGYDIAEFADIGDRDKSLLSRIERGERGVSIETLARIWAGLLEQHEEWVAHGLVMGVLRAIASEDRGS